MDIAGPSSTPPTLTLIDTAGSTSWRIGQRLDALVTTTPGEGKITLDIEGIVLEARTTLAASVGQRLNLEVIRSDNNQIVLRIIPSSPASDRLTAALREILPHQLPLQTVFSRLTAILPSSSQLPPAITALLKQLIDQLPDRQSICRPDGLKHALHDSGLFLEHKLGGGSEAASPATDLKANLLRLFAEASRSNDDAGNPLVHHVEAGLARIQLHQLSALTEIPMTWTGEIPVQDDRHVDVFQFHIERDAKTAAEPEQQSWSTWLSFDLKTLGPISVKLALTNKTVATTIWAELNSTVDLINQNLDFLHQSLRAVGLEIRDLQCRQGNPALPLPKRLPQGLLDLTA
jgi:hypothetical protein